MLLKGMATIGFMAIAVIVSTGTMTSVNTQTEAARTRSVTDSNVSTCTTGVGVTQCEIDLTETSQYSDISVNGGSVLETSPSSVDRTDQTTLNNDRTKITITGLTASTSYIFDINFFGLASGVDQTTSNVMQYIPMVIIFGVLFISLLWLLSTTGVLGKV